MENCYEGIEDETMPLLWQTQLDCAPRQSLPNMLQDNRQIHQRNSMDNDPVGYRSHGICCVEVCDMNVNRMLVTEHDSHVTEERRIQDKIADGVRRLKNLTARLDEELYDHRWSDASETARRIASITDYVQKLEYRLKDVVDINAQFARIQEHIDRLEKELRDKEK